MDPPRADFQRELEECRDLIDGLGQDPQAAPLRGLVQRIEDEGNTAATTKNHRKWSTTCENLGRLHARISALVTGPQEGAAPQELPPTPMLKDHFAQRVETLRSDLEAAEGTRRRDSDYAGQWQTVCAELWNTLNQMEAAVEKVDDASESRQALAQLQLAMRPEDSLKTKIRQVREGVGTRQERGGPRG
ncbi:MAG: hypothetical protein HYU66_08715 [Armatimonadetes bacterium]|nr:hypothetical protein [Armatimonadota bacterium]